jgi:hypothetical protein
MGMELKQAGVIIALLAATPLSAKVELGKQVFVKDWAAVCDNTLACEAVSLSPDNAPGGGPYMLVAQPTGKDAPPTIKFAGFDSKSDRYRILIDGRSAAIGSVTKADHPIQLSGPAALKLIRAAARGSKLELRDGSGTSLGQISLLGSAAVLRHIDATQNRASTATALAAIGRKRLRSKSLPVPVIKARRIGANDVTPDATNIVKLVESSGCAEERSTVTEDSAYSLGKRDGVISTLVMVSCGSGAYNFSTAPFIGTSSDGKQWQFAPARFDYSGGIAPAAGAPELLVNASWDSASQTISSFAKGRGLGDCGSAESYVWDGAIFRLISASGMSECRGSMEWLTLWRAKVELTD